MFTITPNQLAEYSKTTGFLKNELEKAFRILEILNTLQDHPLLRLCFVLKGGTGLNLFHYPIPRLSVDADLNFIKSLDRETMLQDRKEITCIFPEIFEDEYDVQKSRDDYALLQYEYNYQTISGGYDKLKVNINFLLRLPITLPMEKSFSRYDYSVTLPVLSLEEILAAKIVALLNRYTPRDLYDIYQTSFLKPTLNETLLRYLVLYYGLISRTSIFELFQPQWENVSEYDIRRLLHPLLIRGHYPEREEMIETANIFLQPLLTLTNDEKAVFDRFYRTGELQIEGLFTGEELQENIAQSPAFKWKKGNVMMTAKEERQK